MSRLWREPTQIEVELVDDQPGVLYVNGQRHQVQTIGTHWRLDERWRSGPGRDYFFLITDRGIWGIVYLDLESQEWFLQGIYD